MGCPQWGDVDTAADVFSLGLIFFEMLTCASLKSGEACWQSASNQLLCYFMLV